MTELRIIERKRHLILNGMEWSQAEGQSHLTAQTSYWCAMWFLSAVISSLNMSQSHSQSVTSLKGPLTPFLTVMLFC